MTKPSPYRQAYTLEQNLAMLQAPPFTPPAHLRTLQCEEDFLEHDRLSCAYYHDYLIGKGLMQDPRAHNDAFIEARQRHAVALTCETVALYGQHPRAIFVDNKGRKLDPMSVGKVQQNLIKAHRAATKPIAPHVKDKSAAMSRRQTACETGAAYFEAARRMDALDGVQPREVVRFFRRRALYINTAHRKR